MSPNAKKNNFGAKKYYLAKNIGEKKSSPKKNKFYQNIADSGRVMIKVRCTFSLIRQLTA